MRYCKNCGLLAPYDRQQCPQCGAELPPVELPEEPDVWADRETRYAQAPCPVPALSEGATLVALLLFSIPVAGFILSLAWSLGFTRNPARRRLAQAWLIRTLIVAVVVALVCLWLALTSVLTLSPPHYYYAF